MFKVLLRNTWRETLLSVTTVTSHHDVKGLRRLCGTVEIHIHGLKALGMAAES